MSQSPDEGERFTREHMLEYMRDAADKAYEREKRNGLDLKGDTYDAFIQGYLAAFREWI